MSRLLFFIALGFVIWLVLRGVLRRPQVRDAESRPASRSEGGEDMVTCARCGVNMPRSEAREQSGAYYCRDNPRCA